MGTKQELTKEQVRLIEKDTVRNLELIGAFVDHLKMEADIDVPEEVLVSFFDGEGKQNKFGLIRLYRAIQNNFLDALAKDPELVDAVLIADGLDLDEVDRQGQGLFEKLRKQIG